MQALEEQIREIGIVPVIKLTDPARDAKPLGRALINGGVPLAEVTFRAAGAATAIRILRQEYPEMIVGAGTVLTTGQVEEAIMAGAMFIVSPGLDPVLVEYCQERGIPIFPGCTTATEYHTAYRYGLTLIKFFPASQCGGLSAIKALSAPFPMFKVMPTGGVSLENLGEYMQSPVIAACGGSYMVTQKLIESGNWEEITSLCKQSRNIIKEARA